MSMVDAGDIQNPAMDEDEDQPDTGRDPIMDNPAEAQRMAQYWKGEIAAVEQTQELWHKRGDSILKRYRDERSMADQNGQRRLNLLWSTVQILKPAVYSKVPEAVCERRFADKDPVGRISATILERALRNELTENGFHPSMRRSRDDYLLPGRGQLWVRYEPEIGEGVSVPASTDPDITDAEGRIEPEDEDDAAEKLEQTGSQIISESAPVDYIHWKDFLMFPSTARTWEEVTAVGKRVFTSKTYNIERFGDDIGAKITADPQMAMRDKVTGADTPYTMDDQNTRKRVIYEIWNRADRKVYWVSTGYNSLCDCRQDPLELRNFFPCPEPLSATMTNDSLIPVPDFSEYQDQANQVDELTQRISLLSKACKIAGTYDSANRALKRLLDESVENELIPVDNWAMAAQKGGVAGSMSLLPIKEVAECLNILIGVRAKILEDFDRITGVSALISQTGDGRETLGGQRLKNNGGQTRIEDRRAEVGRFATDAVRLVAEVIAKHFQPETLIEISGILYEEGIDPVSLQPVAPDAPPAPPPIAGPGPGMPPQIGAPAMPGAPPVAAPPVAPPMAPPGQPAMGAPPPSPVPGTSVVPFQPPVTQLQSGAPLLSPKVLQAMGRIKKAIDLLKSDIPRGYRIDIEIDTMIAGDVQQERADATAFIEAVTKFMQAAQLIGAANPAAVPLLAKMLQWGVRKFRTGRDLESAIDEFVDKMEKMAQAVTAGAGSKPNPEAIKAEAAMQASQTEIAKAKLAFAAQEANDKREQERAQIEHQAALEELDMKRQIAREKHQFDMAEIGQQRMASAAKAAQSAMPAGTA